MQPTKYVAIKHDEDMINISLSNNLILEHAQSKPNSVWERNQINS